MEKKCGYCKERKSYDAFAKDKHTPTGLANRCRSCASIIGKEWHRKYRESPERWERLLASRNKWKNNNLERCLVNSAKRRALELGLDFDLSFQDIAIPERCPILGIPLRKGVGKGGQPDSPSLDRFDNTKGYVKENVRVISWRANTIKKDATMEELEKIASYMKGECH
jgi:hypothetical protein